MPVRLALVGIVPAEISGLLTPTSIDQRKHRGETDAAGEMRQFAPAAAPERVSMRLAKRQVDAPAAEHGVLAVRKRRDAVKEKPRRAAPYHDIAVFEPEAAGLVAALGAAEQEDRGQPQRNRDDGCREILLVLVLMQRHFRARLVTIDQARIRREAAKAGALRRPLRQ